VTATLPVAAGTSPLLITGQVGPDTKAESSGTGAGPDPGAGGVRRGASLAERGYRHARFGGVPVLVGPELAAQLKAIGRP
jgi:hypothetical protein